MQVLILYTTIVCQQRHELHTFDAIKLPDYTKFDETANIRQRRQVMGVNIEVNSSVGSLLNGWKNEVSIEKLMTWWTHWLKWKAKVKIQEFFKVLHKSWDKEVLLCSFVHFFYVYNGSHKCNFTLSIMFVLGHVDFPINKGLRQRFSYFNGEVDNSVAFIVVGEWSRPIAKFWLKSSVKRSM